MGTTREEKTDMQSCSTVLKLTPHCDTQAQRRQCRADLGEKPIKPCGRILQGASALRSSMRASGQDLGQPVNHRSWEQTWQKTKCGNVALIPSSTDFDGRKAGDPYSLPWSILINRISQLQSLRAWRLSRLYQYSTAHIARVYSLTILTVITGLPSFPQRFISCPDLVGWTTRPWARATKNRMICWVIGVVFQVMPVRQS